MNLADEKTREEDADEAIADTLARTPHLPNETTIAFFTSQTLSHWLLQATKRLTVPLFCAKRLPV